MQNDNGMLTFSWILHRLYRALTNKLSTIKLIVSDRLIGLSKCITSIWFQFLKHEYLLVSSHLSRDSTQYIQVETLFFTIFSSFIDQTTHQLVEKMIKRMILQWKWIAYEFENTSVSPITGCKSIN